MLLVVLLCVDGSGWLLVVGGGWCVWKKEKGKVAEEKRKLAKGKAGPEAQLRHCEAHAWLPSVCDCLARQK